MLMSQVTNVMADAAYALTERREHAYALGIMLGITRDATTPEQQRAQWDAARDATEGDPDRWALFVMGWNAALRCLLTGVAPMPYEETPIARGVRIG